jgi:hypothetical protein
VGGYGDNYLNTTVRSKSTICRGERCLHTVPRFNTDPRIHLIKLFESR